LHYALRLARQAREKKPAIVAGDECRSGGFAAICSIIPAARE
jgi:hypothetical protein